VTAGPGVPFIDLRATDRPLGGELQAAWQEVTGASAFIGGPHVEAFETDFAAYCGTGHCVGVGNGTDALELALACLGIGPGDEVIVPANTFVATASAVVSVGASPVFVDVDPSTMLVTADAVRAGLTGKTAAVIVVHLYGQVPDMDAIADVAATAGIAVVEDAAQAHGAAWDGRRAGSFGHVATFSFYPAKNLGAFGDGGAVVTGDGGLAATIRSRANHGRSRSRHHHRIAGRNSRLDGLQAAVLRVKLRHLDEWNAARRRAHELYASLLSGSPVRPVSTDPRATPVHHLEVVEVDDRRRVVDELTERDVGWGLHYPVPCHRQPAFARYADGPLAVAEVAADRIVSLPMFPTITAEQIEQVCDAVLAGTGAPQGVPAAAAAPGGVA
jgi:dTDP-4-amino-4,6-dideoxygalactose transaminase